MRPCECEPLARPVCVQHMCHGKEEARKALCALQRVYALQRVCRRPSFFWPPKRPCCSRVRTVCSVSFAPMFCQTTTERFILSIAGSAEAQLSLSNIPKRMHKRLVCEHLSAQRKMRRPVLRASLLDMRCFKACTRLVFGATGA